MTGRTAAIDEIIAVMKTFWDLPADCNDGELFAYAEVLLDRIRAGEGREALHEYLADVQAKLDMPPSDAFKAIADRSNALVDKPT